MPDKLFLGLISYFDLGMLCLINFPSSSQGQQSVEPGTCKLILQEEDVVLWFAGEKKYAGVSSAKRIVQNLAPTVVA